MGGHIPKYLGFYLPRRFRRWFLYFPLDGVLLLVGIIAAILIRAAFISAGPLYPPQGVSADAELQFRHLEAIVDRSTAESRLDIHSGYSRLCGTSNEWDYGFYVFYAMSLDELAAISPERRKDIAHQIDACTRLMLRLPADADAAACARRAEGRAASGGSIIPGNECLVLSIRKQLVGDTIYDKAILAMADTLDTNLRAQLKHCGMIWTSDQATQLYALWCCDRALGTDHHGLFALGLATMQSRFIQKGTGLLYSRVDIDPDRIESPPRGTSIAWTVIFLADLFPDFAARQYASFRKYRVCRVATLSAVREFPGPVFFRFGDLDSGPLILGISPSASGFGLCAHRLFGTPADYVRGYRVFELFGEPRQDATGKYYRLGNGMGDAILLYSKVARPRRPARIAHE